MTDRAPAHHPPAERQRTRSALAWSLSLTTLCVIGWGVRYAIAGGTWEHTPSAADLLAGGAALVNFGDDLAALTLHVTPIHILSNALLLAVALTGWTHFARVPWARALAGIGLGHLAGAGAFAAAHAIHALPSCGASGVVYALVAMVLVALWIRRAALPPRLRTLGPAAVTAAALAALGASFAGPEVDALAHAFGFGFGALLALGYEALSAARFRDSGTRAG